MNYRMSRSEAVAENPDPFHPAVEKAIAEAVVGGPSLLLISPPGGGKSVALRVISKRLGCKFVTDRDIIDAHRKLMENCHPDEARNHRIDVERLRAVRAICVDDLASGTGIPYTAYETGIIADLVDRWWEAGTTIFASSNKPLRELGSILGPRTISRFVGMARIVEFAVPDQRIALAGAAPPTGPDPAVREAQRRARAEYEERTDDVLPGETRSEYAERRARWATKKTAEAAEASATGPATTTPTTTGAPRSTATPTPRRVSGTSSGPVALDFAAAIRRPAQAVRP